MIILSLKKLGIMLSMILLGTQPNQPNHSGQGSCSLFAVGTNTANTTAYRSTRLGTGYNPKLDKRINHVVTAEDEKKYNKSIQFIQTHIDPNFQGNPEDKASYLAITNANADGIASTKRPYPEPIQAKSQRQHEETLCLLESEGIEICIEFNLVDNTKLNQLKQFIKETTAQYIQKYGSPSTAQRWKCTLTELAVPPGRDGYHLCSRRAETDVCKIQALLNDNTRQFVKHQIVHLLDDLYINNQLSHHDHPDAMLFREGHAQYMATDERLLDSYLIQIHNKLNAASVLPTENPFYHQREFSEWLKFSEDELYHRFGPIVIKYIDDNYDTLPRYMDCLHNVARDDSHCNKPLDAMTTKCKQQHPPTKRDGYAACMMNTYMLSSKCRQGEHKKCLEHYLSNNFNMEQFSAWLNNEIALRIEYLDLVCDHTAQVCRLTGDPKSAKPIFQVSFNDTHNQIQKYRYDCPEKQNWIGKQLRSDGQLPMEPVTRELPYLCKPIVRDLSHSATATTMLPIDFDYLHVTCNQMEKRCLIPKNNQLLLRDKSHLQVIVEDDQQAIQKYNCFGQGKEWMLKQEAESKDGKLPIELAYTHLPKMCLLMEETPIIGTRTILSLGAAAVGLSSLGAVAAAVKKPRIYRRLRGF